MCLGCVFLLNLHDHWRRRHKGGGDRVANTKIRVSLVIHHPTLRLKTLQKGIRMLGSWWGCLFPPPGTPAAPSLQTLTMALTCTACTGLALYITTHCLLAQYHRSLGRQDILKTYARLSSALKALDSQLTRGVLKRYEALEQLLLRQRPAEHPSKDRLERELQHMELELLKSLETLDGLSFAPLKAIPSLSTSHSSDLQFLQSLADKHVLKLRTKKKRLVSKILDRMARLDQHCSQWGFRPVSQLHHHSPCSLPEVSPDVSDRPPVDETTGETHSRCSSTQETLIGGLTSS